MTAIKSLYRDVFQHWFDALQSNDIETMKEAFRKYYTPGYTLHDPTAKKPESNFDDFLNDIEQVFGNMNIVKVEVEDFLQDGDKTVTRGTFGWTDRETKEYHKIAAIFVSRFEGDKIAEEWQFTAPI